MVECLHVHGDHDRNPHGDLADVVDAHDDQVAVQELGAAGVHDGDARPVPLDRLLDTLVPDGVAGDVDVVEHEAAHRPELVGDRSEAVSCRGTDDTEPLPVDLVGNWASLEPQFAQWLLVLGLTEDGKVARQQLSSPAVEVVPVSVRHEDGVEPLDDLLGRKGQRHGGIRNWIRRVGYRWAGSDLVEHRVDEDTTASELEDQGCVADERQPHRCIFYLSARALFVTAGGGYTPRLVPNETAEKPATTEEEGVWTTGPDGELVPDYSSAFPEINEGEVVHGTVVRVDKDEVLVDIGYKSEGVIPVAELTIRRAVNPADEVSVGEEIDALVLTKEDTEGRLILSKKRARFELAWKKIEEAAESGEPVTGKVIEVVKGGLILDLGVRGFLPASLVDIRRVQDLDEFLGRELRCKVIELNRSRNNVVLSRRAVLEDERKEMRQAILDRLSPGDVIEGQISNIVDFGAFVDLDGMDGLIHISELSWSHVNHPSEVLEIGQTVKVKVLDIDRERQRISLGLKQTQSDPWQQVLDSYREGDVVEGRVAKVVTFGAFVEILPGVEGLVHISELAPHHVENPREVVSQGQPVNVKILEIDGERRRLSLSLKRVEEGEQPVPRADGGESVHTTPELVLTEEAFPASSATAMADETPAEISAETAAEVVEEVEAGEEVEEEAVEAEEPRAEAETAPADEPAAEASPAESASESAAESADASDEAADEPDAAA